MWDLGLAVEGPQLHQGTMLEGRREAVSRIAPFSIPFMSTKQPLGWEEKDGLFPSGTFLRQISKWYEANALFIVSSTYYIMKKN